MRWVAVLLKVPKGERKERIEPATAFSGLRSRRLTVAGASELVLP